MKPVAAVALATCAKVPDLTPDDQLLVEAFGARGIAAEPVVWDAMHAEWEKYDSIVIRSCWDYHLRAAEFRAWIDGVERAGVRLCNPAQVLRWNAEKTYLRDLEERGVDIVPTHWIDSGTPAPLTEILEQRGWDDVVVKPSVSASAYQTRRMNLASAAAHDPWFSSLATAGGVLVQPYLSEIESAGEWSLIFVGGRFSHAALKRPAPGDFRVQTELGGNHQLATPDPVLVETAARIQAMAPAPCVFARVDGCVVDGRFVLMELELLEPVLFLGLTPGVADRLAGEIAGTFDS